MTCAAENNRLHKATQELQELHAAHQLQMANINSQLKQKDLRINELHNFTKVRLHSYYVEQMYVCVYTYIHYRSRTYQLAM